MLLGQLLIKDVNCVAKSFCLEGNAEICEKKKKKVCPRGINK